MESRHVAPAAGSREGRRVDGEDGVRMRWEPPAGPLSPNPGFSVLCGRGGARSLPFSKVQQRNSPLPHPQPPPSRSSAAPAPTASQELLQSGPNQHDLAGKGVRDGGVGDGGTGESDGPQV